MKVVTLTFACFQINAASDTGTYDDITVDDVKRQIAAGTILPFLRHYLGSDIDLSVLTIDDETEIVAEWQDMLAIDERRKMGVRRKGLSLLVAYLIEGIQRRSWSI